MPGIFNVRFGPHSSLSFPNGEIIRDSVRSSGWPCLVDARAGQFGVDALGAFGGAVE